jgi:hypothetical protein
MNLKKLLSQHLDSSKSVMIYTRANSVVVRSHPKHVKQPGTPAQQRVWNRMRAVQSFLKPLKSFIAESFQEVTQKGYPYAQATKYLMREALVEEADTVHLDFSRCWISLGSLDPLPELDVEVTDSSFLRLFWNLNKEPTDREGQHISLVYVSDVPSVDNSCTVWISMNRAEVNSGEFVIEEWPTIYDAETIHVYIAVHTDDRKQWAKSQYVGRLDKLLA